MDFLDLFPPELSAKIFYYLSIDDLLSVSIVSVSWYIASNSSWLWRAAIKQSSSRDRFNKLSDLDKFNRIISNYDSGHSFNVERPLMSRLPPMNPWKLSLCQHTFVQSNLCGGRPKLKLAGRPKLKLARRLMLKLASRPKFELARRRIAMDNGMEILDLNVTFLSKSAQDGLYLPVLVRKPGEINKVFYLMRLDGVIKSIPLLTTDAEISYACIDRHGIVWLEVDKVSYLSFVENFWLDFNSAQIKNLGSVCLESDDSIMNRRCLLTMDTNHFAVCYKFGHVKIWGRKILKLKITITPEASIQSFNFNNGHFYLALSRYGVHENNYVQIYDVKQGQLISVLDVESLIERFVFGVKYYAIVSDTLICVREIKTNNVMFNVTVKRTVLISSRVFLFVDDNFLYVDDVDLKILNLADWTVRKCMSLQDYSYINYIIDLDVIDRCLLVIGNGTVDVWDRELGRKLQEIVLSERRPYIHRVHVNEIRLVHVGKTSFEVVGFW